MENIKISLARYEYTFQLLTYTLQLQAQINRMKRKKVMDYASERVLNSRRPEAKWKPNRIWVQKKIFKNLFVFPKDVCQIPEAGESNSQNSFLQFSEPRSRSHHSMLHSKHLRLKHSQA